MVYPFKLFERISSKVDPMKCTTKTIFTRDKEVGTVKHAEEGSLRVMGSL